MAPSRGLERDAGVNIKADDRLKTKLQDHRSSARPQGPTYVNLEHNAVSTLTSTGRKGALKERAKQLLAGRQKLPIWNHQDEIRAKLRQSDILLLVSETGSGKSTQIPQFLVNEKWCHLKTLPNGKKVGGCIAITQPRRVAAISLARRVAEEMGSPLGSSSPASEVGYSVRFDNSTSPSTRIKFLTEGMLLQEMLRDPWLKEYSAVVVDEVHERGVNVDLVLAFLRQLLERCRGGDISKRKGVGMKVVVMSATADMEKIKDFFDSKAPADLVTMSSGITNTGDLTAEDGWDGFSDDDTNTRPKSTPTPSLLIQAESLFIKGRRYPVQIHYSQQPVADIIEASLERITNIHKREPLPGDILVFMTGQETVDSLLALVEQYGVSIHKDRELASSLPKLLVLPLYAALPSHLQQRIFEHTPKFTRKVIIATNIAETSITVPGVRHVIDCGKSKRRIFRPSLNLDSLLTTPISRSSANQRSGRAGRDAPGNAYRLYTEAEFYRLAVDTEPEILRCDLSQLVITLKSHDVVDLKDFPLLTRPPKRALERAIMSLLQLQALDPTSGQITALGREISLLPLPGYLARILLASAAPKYDCVDEVIDIVSALSVENIFLNIHASQPLAAAQSQQSGSAEGDDEQPQDARLRLRRQFYRREGDHLTLLATVQAYVEENVDRKRWCEERAINHRAMQAVMDVRKQLTGLMMMRRKREKRQCVRTEPDGDGVANGNDNHHKNDSSDLSVRILRCLLTGLYPNVARLSTVVNGASKGPSFLGGGQYITLSTNQAISIHPSSVLFGKKVEAIMSSEFVFTTKAYARCVSAVQMVWVADAT
ncbi:hypothetical protein DV736_g358, partial [Chaetothyriales sp. CBS 134916]